MKEFETHFITLHLHPVLSLDPDKNMFLNSIIILEEKQGSSPKREEGVHLAAFSFWPAHP
jgi:hypothetical protein